MPAKSKAQRVVAAIAEHHPEQLYDRNKGMANMSISSLHHFAATPTKNLPKHVNGNGKGGSHPHRNLGAYLHKSKGK